VLLFPPVHRQKRHDARRKAGNGHSLEPYLAGADERRQEKAFAAEKDICKTFDGFEL
jgi:hypothetical protein